MGRAQVAAAALLAAAGIASCQVMMPPGPTISLRVKGNVADAQVTIDDIPLGPLGYVAAHGVALPQGEHRVTVERNGFFPWDTLVVAEEKPVYLDVVLVPIPD